MYAAALQAVEAFSARSTGVCHNICMSNFLAQPFLAKLIPPYLLQLTRRVDCRLYFIANLAALRAGRLDGLDDLFGFLVCNFAEDDVFAIKPVGHDGGDEELGAISIYQFFPISK